MPVIAMTREMGSLGKDVAAGLTDQLGLAVVHHELVEHHLAERLGVKESTVHRYLEGEASLLEEACRQCLGCRAASYRTCSRIRLHRGDS